MSIYGEGLYRDAERPASCPAASATREQLRRGDWEVRDAAGRGADPRAHAGDEAAGARLGLRALQVRPGAAVPDGRAAPTASPPWRCASSTSTAPRQALSNPYTGVLAIFASRLLNGKPPLIFEDGAAAARLRQRRTTWPAPAGWRWRRRGAPGTALQHRQRPAVHGRARSPARMAEVLGREGDRAGDHRQVPRRRHPPLLRRHHAGPRACSATSREVRSSKGWRSSPRWLEGQVAVRPRRRGARRAGRAGADGMTPDDEPQPCRRSPAAPASSAPTWRDRLLPRRAARVLLFDNLSRAGRRATISPGCASTHGDRGRGRGRRRARSARACGAAVGRRRARSSTSPPRWR